MRAGAGSSAVEQRTFNPWVEGSNPSRLTSVVQHLPHDGHLSHLIEGMQRSVADKMEKVLTGVPAKG